MPGLTYGTFEAALHPYFTPKITKLALTNILLLSPLIDFPMPDKEFQKSPDSVDDATASRARTGKRALPPRILELYAAPDALKHIKESFAANIIPRVQENARKALLRDILSLVQTDRELSPETKEYFEQLAVKETLGNFLAEVYLCAISQKAPVQRVSNLPAQNNFFLGRETQLKLIEKQFQNGISVQGLFGTGGVGKTQLALQYAYAHLADYETVWWINAETVVDLQNSIIDLLSARKILPNDRSADNIRSAFQDYCNAYNNWFFIYDNAEYEDNVQYDVLKDYFPHNLSNGVVLLTTRCKNAFENAVQYEVPVFGPKEASQFLQLRSKCSNPGSAQIAERLGFLPLALEYAAAYIRETPGVDYAAYSRKLEQYSVKLLDRKVGHLSYKWTVRETFHITLDKLLEDATANPVAMGAVQFLNLCAYLAPDGIEINVFTKYGNCLPEPIRSVLRNELDRDELIRDLTRYSLVRTDLNTLSIHRLLQEVLRDEIDTQNEREWISCGINVFEDSIKINRWLPADVLRPIISSSVPHMLTLFNRDVQNYKKQGVTLSDKHTLYISREYIFWSSYTLFDMRKVKSSGKDWAENEINDIPALQAIIDFFDKMPSEKNFYLARVLHLLGNAYVFSGVRSSVLECYNRSIKISKTVADGLQDMDVYQREAVEYTIDICMLIGEFSFYINEQELLETCYICLLKNLQTQMQTQLINDDIIVRTMMFLQALSIYISAATMRAFVLQIKLPMCSCLIKETAPYTNINFSFYIPDGDCSSSAQDASIFDILIEKCNGIHSARQLNGSWTTMAFPKNIHTEEEMLSYLEEINVKKLTISAKRSLYGMAYTLAHSLNEGRYMQKFKNKLKQLADTSDKKY